MDTASGADRDFFKTNIEISAPLVRKFRGNARCAPCKASGRECYLEHPSTGRQRCLTCDSDEECRFRRVVIQEDAVSRFSWEELTREDIPVIDTSDATKDDKHSSRKRQRHRQPSPVVNTSHARDVVDSGNLWRKPEPNHGNLTKSSIAHQDRDLLAPELERLCQTFTREQVRLVKDLYRRCPHTTDKDMCILKSVFDATIKKQRHHDVASLVSEPTTRIRTNLSHTPYQNLQPPFTAHAHTEGDDPFNMPPSITQYSDVDYAGDWTNPFYYSSNEYLQLLYVPGSTSVTDRHDSVIHDLNNTSTQFEDMSTYFKPSAWKLNPGEPVSSPLEPTSTRSTTAIPKLNTNSTLDIPEALPFKCVHCGDLLNTRSEFRKHTARHTKPFVCTVTGCSRATDGFATRNDLDRHIASLHDTTHAFKMYKCAVPGCKDPTKVWARKDNFKAHIKRMHPEANAEEYLEKSVVEPQDACKDEG